MNKQEAKVLFADSVRLANANQATKDFNMQRKLNTMLGQAVGHIALAFSPNDTSALTDERMITIAQQYLNRMFTNSGIGFSRTMPTHKNCIHII